MRKQPIIALILVALAVVPLYGAKYNKGKGQQLGRGGTTAASSSQSGPDNPNGGGAPTLPACTYWAAPANASPAGSASNNGLSAAQPFRPQDFWSLGQAPIQGKVLCLKNGTYTGTAFMLSPPGGISGTTVNKIWVRAENDGGVLIDGEHNRPPLWIQSNTNLVFQGFDARKGSFCVICDDTGGNEFRRIIAYDANICCNTSVFTSTGVGTLFEDIAAFGTGRKLHTVIGSNGATTRRAFFRYEGTLDAGGQGMSIMYNSVNGTFENIIMNWTAYSMPQTYLGSPGSQSMSNFNLVAPGQPIATDQYQPGPPGTSTNNHLLGSVSYVLAGDRANYAGGTISAVSEVSGYVFKDLISWLSPANTAYNSHYGYEVNNFSGGTATADRVTAIRGSLGDSITNGWTFTNDVRTSGSSDADALSVLNAANANPYNGTTGGQFCKRYVNRVKTDQKLFPWPMNDRIKAATAAAGRYTGPCRRDTGQSANCSWPGGQAPIRPQVDVQATIVSLFGTIPAECTD